MTVGDLLQKIENIDKDLNIAVACDEEVVHLISEVHVNVVAENKWGDLLNLYNYEGDNINFKKKEKMPCYILLIVFLFIINQYEGITRYCRIYIDYNISNPFVLVLYSIQQGRIYFFFFYSGT